MSVMGQGVLFGRVGCECLWFVTLPGVVAVTGCCWRVVHCTLHAAPGVSVEVSCWMLHDCVFVARSWAL